MHKTYTPWPPQDAFVVILRVPAQGTVHHALRSV